MEIRIKEKSAKIGIEYAVQVKRFLLWKTVASYTDIKVAIDFANELKNVNDFNKPKNEKVEYYLWAVRPKYSDYSSYVDMYLNCPCKRIDKDGWVTWGSGEKIRMKVNELFGSECLEPMKVKITIEKI